MVVLRSPVPPGGRRGRTGTPARGVCQNVADIPVVSFPHRLIPQLPLPAAVASIAADFPFPDTQLPYQNLLLEQSHPRRWGLWQAGCILHPPKPEGPSPEGKDPRLECDPTLG